MEVIPRCIQEGNGHANVKMFRWNETVSHIPLFLSLLQEVVHIYDTMEDEE